MQRSLTGATGRFRVSGLIVTGLIASAVVTTTGLTGAPVAQAAGTTITLEAIEDTFVALGAPSTNFGSADYIDVYGGYNPGCLPAGLASKPAYGLLKFDLSDLPDGAIIESVTLRTTTRAGWAQDGDGFHHALLLADDTWDDGTTWNSRPDDGTLAWTDDPLAGDPTASGGGDIRLSDAAVGASFVYRNSCLTDPAANEPHTFPTPTPFPIPEGYQVPAKDPDDAGTDLVVAVRAARDSDDLISFQLYAANNCGPDAFGCGGTDKSYWARYHTREAESETVRPQLIVRFAGDLVSAPTPVLASVVSNASGTVVTGALTGSPGTYTIEVKSCDGGTVVPSSHFGSFPVVVDGSGTAAFSEPISAGEPIGVGEIVAIRARALGMLPSGPSDCVLVQGVPPGDGVPVLVQAVPSGTETIITGRLSGFAGTEYYVSIQTASSCTDGVLDEGAADIAGFPVMTDDNGDIEFTETIEGSASTYVAAQAAIPDSDFSDPSPCIVVGPDNDTWTRALEIPLTGGPPLAGQATGFVDTPGGARWYKVAIEPGARLTVDLTDLPADYDLALFKDIGQAFTELTSPADLTRLSAEFAPSVFSPSVFSPSVFSPSVFSPDAYAPSVFSPSVFSPSVFSPSVFSPSVFSPSVFSPSVFSPSVFSPSVFSPSVFSPSVFSPDATAPSVFSADAFTNAQTRSLIGVAATAGTGAETIVADTWNNTGYFYIRVAGRNGAFDPSSAFTVSASLDGTLCTAVVPMPGAATATAGGFGTIVVWDRSRFDTALPGNSDPELDALAARLDEFVARPEIDGVVVDVSTDARVVALNAQADEETSCPYAKNLVAGAIKDIVDAHRTLNPDLEYVVIVGNDSVIPFFRYPDQSMLGPESDYEPPVLGDSASEASLRLNYVLGQDEYGADVTLSLRDGQFPVPDLAVGRLVESASEATGMLDAYLGLDAGVVPTPTSALVTGYDFLADAADLVSYELGAGIGAPVNDLITPNGLSPEDPLSWTADDLRDELLGQRHDVIFLAGHFSANSALAADFSTSMITTELVASPVDLRNSIVFSTGCHSGYTIVDGDVVPGVTLPLDWTQAFAQKQATLIAGTGYQYGDTDFLEYSERIYGDFARELRTGTGPVSVGQALVKAKQHYLSTTPDVRGLHRKALLITTVYGLPMLSVDMPTGRIPARDDVSVVTALLDADRDPGETLELQTAELSSDPELTPTEVQLTDLGGGAPITATYLRGPDGVVTNPAEPALPLISQNVSVPGKVLRGVGFRGGDYEDVPGIVPLTGAPTTELRGVHSPFTSPVWFPMRIATVNYYGALGDGDTRLLITPAQHRAEPGGITSTLRRYDSVDLRLYYSSNIETYGANTPALAAAPSISDVTYAEDGDDLVVGATVIGDPSAGVQEVWVTYTGHAPLWEPLDLVQCIESPDLPDGCDTVDSTRWVGRITGLTDPGAVLFVVQAANGVGLVTFDDNFGVYYGLGTSTASAGAPSTVLTLDTPPTSGAYGTTVPVAAVLTSGGLPLAGRTVILSIGGANRLAFTDADGRAEAGVALVTAPGPTQVSASFAGDATVGAASTDAPFTVDPAATTTTITQTPVQVGNPLTDLGITVTLAAANGGPLMQRTVFVTLDGPTTRTVAVITNHLGRAVLGPLDVPAGAYDVTAAFAGDSVYLPSDATTSVVVGGQVELTELLTELRLLLPGMTGLDAKRVQTAIRELEQATAPSRWVSPWELDPKSGHKSLGDISKAGKALLAVKPMPPAVLDALDVLVNVSRSLASEAIDAARAGSGNQRRINEAVTNLGRGDAEAAAARPEKAIDRYGDAWKKAQDALKTR